MINLFDDWKAQGPVHISLGQPKEKGDDPRVTAGGLPELLPLVAVKEISLFPRMVLPMVLDVSRHQALVDEVVSGNKLFGLAAYKPGLEPGKIKETKDLYPVGILALVLQMSKNDSDQFQMIIQGLGRFRIESLAETDPFLLAKVDKAEDILVDDLETKALFSNLRSAFNQTLELSPHLPDELKGLAAGIGDPGAFCDMVASALSLKPEDMQQIVAALDVKQRLTTTTDFVNREIEVLRLGSEIQSQVKQGMDERQREYLLRQQLKAIQKELGEDEAGQGSEAEKLKQKLDEKELPGKVREEAERELKRLASMHPSSSDYHVITGYMDWILRLPWLEASEAGVDLQKAREILERDHYGLDKVKRRILEYLAVLKLNPDMKGPILCFVGPPGVGKTSLGRSIARSLGREFARISLGGVRDEAEIRGHRRTYVGAMPGRIIQSLGRAGANNPVFMLDEIDKVGADFRGDPSSALLEVLDPEQNNSFSDHYLDLPFDLSKVIFITTANVLDTIPPPLRDRMEVLELPGYTAQEKLKIAKRYLLPRQRREHGLKASQLAISDAAIKLLIVSYTREAGVRNLEREIGSLCRHAARLVAEGQKDKVKIGPDQVREILGPEKITPDARLRTSVPGVATGMAWTPAGGDILFIEASGMPGKGGLTLTGQLGDVMKESARAAVSFVRSNAEKLGVDPDFHSKMDIHIHVPQGAIPKDGPSAGVTMFTAILSLLTGKKVRPDVSMTGEITLRGHVLPVGGIKEKVLAAHRAGIKKIIMPAQNQRDLIDIPDTVKKKLEFVFAETVDQVAKAALSGK